MYYSSFGVLALILHFILNYEFLKDSKKENAVETAIRYRSFLASVVAYYAADVLWGVLYQFKLYPFSYVDTVFYFFAMALSVLLWTRFVVSYFGRTNRFAVVLTYAGWSIFTFMLISLIANFFAPVMFEFAPEGYKPHLARYVTLGAQILMFMGTSVYVFLIFARTKGRERQHCKIVGYSGVAMTVFIFLQALDPLFPFYAVGCLVATSLIHSFVVQYRKRDRERELGQVKHMAYTDPLTGVNNVHAYIEAKSELDKRIADGTAEDFAVVVFDLNDLKSINDNMGHDEGNRRIQEACRLICGHFKHSSVYRIGGDEFLAILRGADYEDRERLLELFDERMEKNKKENKVLVSGGLDTYSAGHDGDFEAVFQRADRKMYEKKTALKIPC